MSITGEQTQQRAQLWRALAAELSLAGLDHQFIAGLEILELDLAAAGVEVMPCGGLDLVTGLGHHAIDIGGLRGHECRHRRTHGNARSGAQCAPIHGHLQIRAAGVQIADAHHAELRGQAGVSGHAGISGANILAPPVVVHLIDAIDQDEAGLGKVVGRGHDHVPHAPRRQGLVDAAGHQAFLVGDIAFVHRPFAPDKFLRHR